MRRYLRAGQLITGPTVYEDGAVLIEDGTIEAAGRADDIEAPDADRERHLPDHTLMPGLIDGHVHLTGPDAETGSTADLFATSPAEMTLRTLHNAQRTLHAGVTTVRDCGGANDLPMAVRDRIARGEFVGPRIVAAGQGLSATHGHGDLLPWHIETHLGTDSGNIGSKGVVADGPDGVRQAVRERLKLGADFIKVWATDGIGDASGGTVLSFTREELAAICDEAGRHGLTVAAHAYGAEAIKACIDAGVHSIEHGLLMDEEAIDRMVAEDVHLTFTYATIARIANDDGYLSSPNAKEALDHQLEMVPVADDRGVNFAMGTDAGTLTENGENALELVHMVEDAGFAPLEAIRIATAGSANMLGLDETIGTLEPGYAADLLAVNGDPLADITTLADPDAIDLVIRDGLPVKDTSS
ncbi:MAG: amidohydrolase family protein [Halobacteriales archaeon]|nr:amidohydrolase family protein [Halobacteriales archaeon]